MADYVGRAFSNVISLFEKARQAQFARRPVEDGKNAQHFSALYRPSGELRLARFFKMQLITRAGGK